MAETKRPTSLLAKVIAIVLIAIIFLFSFDYILAPLVNVKPTERANIHVLIIAIVTVVLLYVLKDFSKATSKYFGPHISGLLNFLLEITIVTAGTLAIMATLHVSLTIIMVSGGIAAIIIGLAISTLASNLISGMFIYAAFPIRVGDSVFVNNIPGKVNKITAIYTSVMTEGGTELVIPNSAVVQGYFLIAKGNPERKTIFNYRKGDQVSLPALNVEGSIIELNEVTTEVATKKGTLIIPTYVLLTGGALMAKVGENIKFTIKVSKNVEKVKKALEDAGASVAMTSLEGDSVELTLTIKPAPGKEAEYKEKLIKIAYEEQQKG
ncbi:MAG TPA: mechanosensitive ion channel [Thermoprotei archaeon]|nr:mechanosensitive ion channel [Thermoprotei archaeon]